MGGSGAATCPERVTYSEASTVSPDPMGKCRTPVYTVQASKFGPRPPRVRTGPLEWDPNPPYGVWAAHSGVPGFQDRTYLGLNQDPGGGLELTRVQTQSGGIRTLSHTLLLPAQTETRCCHVAYYARRKPTSGAWHKASGLRASLHLLRIRRVSVHSSDRRRAQSMLRGPCSYSHVTIARTMTHHYS
jgi:hypothetical protein